MTADRQGYKDKRVLEFLIDKRYRLRRHALFLIAFLLILYGADFVHTYGKPFGYYRLLIIYLIFIAMFYVNMYVLIPLFLFRSKYITYSVCLILLALVGIEILDYLQTNFFDAYKLDLDEEVRRKSDLYSVIILCSSLISVSTSMKLLQRWLKDNERISELKNITFTMELNVLKNQISPHFLFNMLNNVKALIRTNPEMANTVIIRLSEFLRYQLYESSGEKTLLTTEIEFLSNFLNLEKIRKDNFEVEINCNLDKNTTNNIFIPPGLFTVFIENAIKHSVDPNGEETYVKIELSIKDQKLYFSCVNSKSEQNHLISKNKSSGLGLTNIKRRLELLYNSQYQLDLISSEREYRINLIVPI